MRERGEREDRMRERERGGERRNRVRGKKR